jgi:hypothetical protein
MSRREHYHKAFQQLATLRIELSLQVSERESMTITSHQDLIKLKLSDREGSFELQLEVVGLYRLRWTKPSVFVFSVVHVYWSFML